MWFVCGKIIIIIIIIIIIVDWKNRDSVQCWNNAKDCFVGNCEDIEESVGNVKTRSVC